MNHFRTIFNKKCSIIGMIHLNALPGTPKYRGSIQKIVDEALHELDTYMRCDLDGILIENMNDIPYVQAKNLGPEIISTLTRVCSEIKQRVINIPCGIQVLAGGNKEALSIALACNLQFIRAEGFVFSHIADEGFTDAIAGQLLRYRKYIGAENVQIFTDIKKKHSSHSITSDVSLVDTAQAAEFFLSDGVILTGTATGKPADINELKDLKSNINIPVLVGSGVSSNNVQNYLDADALIIGSYFKKKGHWQNNLDLSRIKAFMSKVNSLNTKN